MFGEYMPLPIGGGGDEETSEGRWIGRSDRDRFRRDYRLS